MNDKQCLVINLIGGPGSGKSTTMAGVFYYLKKHGVNCEMATEFTKEKVWDEQYRILDEQIYIIGRQHHRIRRLVDKVDIIIMDTTLLSSVIYDKTDNKTLKDFCLNIFNNFNNMVFFIDRTNIKYQTEGRVESLEKSQAIDEAYKNLMDECHIPYTIVNNDNALDVIIKKLEEEGYIEKFDDKNKLLKV